MRQSILRSASELIEEKPQNQLTVAAVTQEVPCSRATFYHYFKNLDQLTLELFELAANDLVASAAPWIGSTHPTEPRFAWSLKGIIDAYVRHQHVMTMMTVVNTDFYWALLEGFDAAVAGRLRVAYPWVPDPDVTARGLNRIHESTWRFWGLGYGEARTPDELFEQTYPIWCMVLRISPFDETPLDDVSKFINTENE